jgi:four helix bundle protein
MGARHFTELAAWRLADEARRYIFTLTLADGVSRDFRFRDQIRGAADSATENIAEGFGRYGHREFARFLTTAKASLDETDSHILAGLSKGYFTESDAAEGRVLIARARRAVLRLKTYLDHSNAPDT